MEPSSPATASTPGSQGSHGSPASPARPSAGDSTAGSGAFAAADGGRSASELLLSEVAQLSAGYDSQRRRASADNSQRARVLRFPTHSRPASPFAASGSSSGRGHKPVPSDFVLPRDSKARPHGPPLQMSASQVSRIQQYRTPPALAAIMQPVPSPQSQPHDPPPQPQPLSPSQPQTPPQQQAQTHTQTHAQPAAPHYVSREREPLRPTAAPKHSPQESPPLRPQGLSSHQLGSSPYNSSLEHEALPQATTQHVSPDVERQQARPVPREPLPNRSAPSRSESRRVSESSSGPQSAHSSPENIDGGSDGDMPVSESEPPPSDSSLSEVDRLMRIVREKQGALGSDAQPSKNAQGQWRYKCPFEGCTKQFKQKAHLQTHVRSHTGERPFVCPFAECGKQFSQQCNLRAHIRAHTGERPFKCRVCGKGFSQQGNMRNHTLIHYNDHPVVCRLDGCERTFNQLGNLKAHQNAAHRATVHAFSTKLEAGTRVEEMVPEEQELFRHFCELYKNSNKGVKGRGKGTKSLQARSGTTSTRSATRTSSSGAASPIGYDGMHSSAQGSPTQGSPTQGSLHFQSTENSDDGLLTPSTSTAPSRASPKRDVGMPRLPQTMSDVRRPDMAATQPEQRLAHSPKLQIEDGFMRRQAAAQISSQAPQLITPHGAFLEANKHTPQHRSLQRETPQTEPAHTGLLLAQPLKMEMPVTRAPTEPLAMDALPAELLPQFAPPGQAPHLDYQPQLQAHTQLQHQHQHQPQQHQQSHQQPHQQQPHPQPLFQQPMQMPMAFQPYGAPPYDAAPPMHMQSVGPVQQPQQFQGPAQWPQYVQQTWDGRQAPQDSGAVPAPAAADSQVFHYPMPAPSSMPGVMPAYMYQNGA